MVLFKEKRIFFIALILLLEFFDNLRKSSFIEKKLKIISIDLKIRIMIEKKLKIELLTPHLHICL